MENLKREYTPNPDKVQPLRFFCQGEPYKFWGLIEGRLRLFCPAENGTAFLLGTDRLGRDVLEPDNIRRADLASPSGCLVFR